MFKKTISCVLIVSLMLSLAACGSPDLTGGSTKTSENESTAASQAASDSFIPVQTGDMDAVVLSTEHFSVSKGELVYLFSMEVNQYSSYFSYLGIDSSRSLKEQYSTAGKSWFDLFMEDTENLARQYLLLSERALEFGFSLTEEDREYIDDFRSSLTSAAEQYDLTLDEYIEMVVGARIPSKYIFSSLELMLLSQKSYDAMLKDCSPDGADVEAYYLAHEKSLAFIAYICFSLAEDDGLAAEVHREYVGRFEKVTEEAALKELAEEYILAVADASGKEITTSRDEYAETIYESYAQIAYANYIEGDSFSEWAFGGAEEGAFFRREEENGNYSVYVLKKTPFRDDTPLVDVRHILFAADEYGSADAARSKAEEIYAQWLAEGEKEDRFIELCAQYSADGNAQSGGIYEGVYQGQMVETFNDWCFDESRKTGDSGLVDTTYGTHMMYFVDGYENWTSTVKDAIRNERYNEMYDALEKKYPVTSDSELIASIVW